MSVLGGGGAMTQKEVDMNVCRLRKVRVTGCVRCEMIAGRADVARASDQIGGREGRLNRFDRWAEKIRNLRRMTIARVVIRIAT